MSEYRHRKLTEEQNRIIDRYQKVLPQDPIDVRNLAKEFGCAVEEARFPPYVSGAIYKSATGPDEYVIQINEAEPLTQRRFTIAHELAHCLLHKDRLGDGIKENIMFRSMLSNKFEVEANKLAAEILMPEDTIESLMSKGDLTFSGLAAIFGVSRAAMLVRLGIPEHPTAYKE